MITARDDDQPIPVEIAEVAGAERIAGGGHVMCAVLNDDLYCWGSNTVGELGRGTLSRAEGVGKVLGLPRPITALAVGGERADAYACAASGTDLRCWGSDAQRQLGSGSPAEAIATNMPGWVDP